MALPSHENKTLLREMESVPRRWILMSDALAESANELAITTMIGKRFNFIFDLRCLIRQLKADEQPHESAQPTEWG